MPYKDKAQRTRKAMEWDNANIERARARKRRWWVMHGGHKGWRGVGYKVSLAKQVDYSKGAAYSSKMTGKDAARKK